MKPKPPIPYETFYPIFVKLNRAKKNILREKIKIKNISHAFSREFISEERYQALLESFDSFQFVTVRYTTFEDLEQSRMELKGMTNLIGSIDFRPLSTLEQHNILRHQNYLYKKLNQVNDETI